MKQNDVWVKRVFVITSYLINSDPFIIWNKLSLCNRNTSAQLFGDVVVFVIVLFLLFCLLLLLLLLMMMVMLFLLRDVIG
mgnify:CR=1 FL=1